MDYEQVAPTGSAKCTKCDHIATSLQKVRRSIFTKQTEAKRLVGTKLTSSNPNRASTSQPRKRSVLSTTKASKRRRIDSSSESCSDEDNQIPPSEEAYMQNDEAEEIVEMGSDEIKIETTEEFDIGA